MSSYSPQFEIHVHGQVPLRPEVTFAHLEDALKPLWRYAKTRSLSEGAISAYEEEPGIRFDSEEQLLQMCWTVKGNDDFRQALDEMCMNLNELAEQGAVIEVTFYDAQYDDGDDSQEQEDAESKDEFLMLFVGPTPAAMLDGGNRAGRGVADDGAELGGVVAEVDKLFTQRFDSLVNSLEIGRPPRGGGGASGHGGGRRPRHLH